MKSVYRSNFAIPRRGGYTILLLCFVVIRAVSLQHARAATDTWTDNNGASDGNWATATNWSDILNGAPNAFDSLDFTGTNGTTANNNFTAGTQFDGITFDANAGAAFNLTGNGILLSGQIAALTNGTNGITNSSSCPRLRQVMSAGTSTGHGRRCNRNSRETPNQWFHCARACSFAAC